VLFIFCVCIYALFSLIYPLRRLKVGNTVWEPAQREERYIFLELYYPNSNLIPPGSFFNIYTPATSNLAFFHGHPFPVCSSRNNRVTFLIQCRKSYDYSSFTEKLLFGKYLHYYSTTLLFDLRGQNICMFKGHSKVLQVHSSTIWALCALHLMFFYVAGHLVLPTYLPYLITLR
jgi:hypothetical protein